MKPEFTKKLLKWNLRSNTRQMPWKGEKDPYRIWLSEIILQQTRVEQGLTYYENFIKTFPDIHSLAAADEQQVFKLWEGLGYYSRCKNLIATAREISKNLNGVFPDNYNDILALKGIGPYTASAIASFAFDLPYAVLDGNVFRVISRYFGISAPIDNADGKKLYTLLATQLLDKKQPAIYNQAIMDFGAVICKPQLPLCNVCVQNKDCQSFQHGWVKELPIKEKKMLKSTRWLYYFMVHTGGRILIKKRTGKDIWENLYEFVRYDARQQLSLTEVSAREIFFDETGSKNFIISGIGEEFVHQLTHLTIRGQIIEITANEPGERLSGYIPVTAAQLATYPFPKIIASYISSR